MSSDIMSVLQDLISEVIPSQKYHMNIDPILNGYGAVDRNSRLFEHTWNTITIVRTFSMMRHPHKPCSAWMSSSLTDGLAVVIGRIDHHGHRTSLATFSCTGLHENMVYERNENRSEELLFWTADAERRMIDPDVPFKFQIIMNFKYSKLSNLRELDPCAYDISDWECQK
jgi:hypothetical protein